MPDLRFDGRVALVTGGGRGLGREYALLLASRGAKVVVNDPGVARDGSGEDASPAAEVVAEIRAAGGDATASLSSIASPAGGKESVETALGTYGRLDIVIHNAGISRPSPFKDMTWEVFSSVVDVHLHGAFHVAQPAFRHMCGAGYGRIVLTSSIVGLYGEHKVASYAVAKAGLLGLSNVMALEGAAEGIKSNVIVPAAVTRLAEGRDISGFPAMTPAQVAPAVAWLAHESCSVTGELLVSLAGRMARAFVGETRGIFQPEWTIEEVADRIDAIRSMADFDIIAPVPRGFYDHLEHSFALARGE